MQKAMFPEDELEAPVLTHPRDLPPEPSADETEYAQACEKVFDDDADPDFEALNAIGAVLLAEFEEAKRDRRETEQRWLQDLRQYKGKYEPEVMAELGPNRSRAFVRKTRVKVKTVDARITDLLFPANAERNWSIAPTPDPTIAPEQREQLAALLAQSMGEKPSEDQVDEAVRQTCEKAARKMATTIDDQLTEAGYKAVAKKVIHSGNLYGTGVLKAPLVEMKVRQRFVKESRKDPVTGAVSYRWVMKTEQYIAPFVAHVPLWHFYPDMAATELSGCRYVYELHPMTRAEILALAKRKRFNAKAIREHVEANPDGMVEALEYESELRTLGDRKMGEGTTTRNGTYDVLERWGWLTGEQLADCGVEVKPEQYIDTYFTNVWLLPTGHVIKASIQPINGVLWPYHTYYLDKDETSLFGEGLATIMRDDQDMLNAGVRMMLDNAAITAGPQIEANSGLLHPGQDPKDIRPFKVWLRTREDSSSPALRVYHIPNSLQELGQIVTMFEANADETTAVPRYVTGENVTQGAAGTASGLSMLMGNSSIVFKDQVSNYDEGITTPFITALYRWNMQFSRDDDIKGDYDIKATGAASLVAKEIRAQQLDAFGQSTANPLDAPFVKRDELLRRRAEALDLPGIVKTKEEVDGEQNNELAKQQAELAAQQQALQMALAQAQVNKLTADAEAAMQKAHLLLAEIAKARAATAQIAVATASDALQAGAAAVTSPHAAAAGDEILTDAIQKTDQSLAEIVQLTQQADQQQAQPQQAPPQQLPAPGAPPDQQPAAPGGMPQ
jgi:hypothetical protein